MKGRAGKGIFIISLDFELHWGMRDLPNQEGYKENFLGVRQAVPSLLRIFNDCGIHATWATVGFLFFETYDELIKELPAHKPHYVNRKYSPYDDISTIGQNEEEDPFHYAPSLIRKILLYPHQEIGSHTFSHYYCLEEGQTINTFSDDLSAAIKVGKKYGIRIESLAFPRNQINKKYLRILKENGIKAYRGNELHYLYHARISKQQLFLRALKLMDSYVNISGHNCYCLTETSREFPFSIRSSRFLRPFSKKYEVFERLRLKRILLSMTFAAKNRLIYHLWWHPHNFGVNLAENMSFLKDILTHYLKLKDYYGMESFNMGELANALIRGNKTK